MGKLIAKSELKREPGFLYYVKSDNEGFLCIYKAVLARGGGQKSRRKK
jgi:hypothetical protein